MKKLILNAVIKDSSVKYRTIDWQGKFRDFIEKNEGERVEIVMEQISDIKHSIHKGYRGYILPDIAHALGEASEARVHYELKKEFLFERCECIEEVPSRHRSRCQYIFDHNSNFLGYVPSMATLTQKDAQEFMRKCKDRLLIDLGSHIGVSTTYEKLESFQNEAYAYISRGLGNEKN